MQIILEDDGIQLLKKDKRYYLRYDAGELMIKMCDLEITNDEAKRVIDNPECAYGIIIEHQDSERFDI